MIKLITTSGKEYHTLLNFQAVQALTKSGNLISTVQGEFINPNTVETITAEQQKPLMSFPSNNFHVPTEEENREAQNKLQPMKAMFEARAQYDRDLVKAQREAINSQSIYGAQKPENTELPKETVTQVKQPKATVRMKKKGK